MFSQRFIYTAMRREQSDGGGGDGCVILQQPCGVIATAGNRWFGGYKFHVTQLSPLEGAKLAKGVLSKAASRSHHSHRRRHRGIATAAMAAAARRRFVGGRAFPHQMLGVSSLLLLLCDPLKFSSERLREKEPPPVCMYGTHTHT